MKTAKWPPSGSDRLCAPAKGLLPARRTCRPVPLTAMHEHNALPSPFILVWRGGGSLHISSADCVIPKVGLCWPSLDRGMTCSSPQC